MKKNILLFTSLVLTVALLTGCGASKSNDSAEMITSSGSSTNYSSSMGYDSGYKSEVSVESENGAGIGGSTNVGVTEEANTDLSLDLEKLIYRSNVAIETLQYEEALAELRTTIAAMDGFIQYESESDNDHNWYYDNHYKTRGTLEAYISCRIPTSKYAAFMEGLGSYGKIVDKNSSVENISQKYNDTSTKIESLKIQEERLLDMLDKAVTIEEMLNIEDRLEEVRYEINSLETDIRHMDMDVAYSYVNVTLTEVLEYTPDENLTKKNTFFDRLKNTIADSAEGFLDFCEELLFAVILLAPYIVIVSVVLFIICKVKKKTLKELFAKKPKEKRSLEGISTRNVKKD